MNKDRVDPLLKLADAAWRSFERRSSYEWRISFALWSGLGLFAGFLLRGGAANILAHHSCLIGLVVLGVSVVILLVYALVWTKGLYERNQNDKVAADTFLGLVEKELGLAERKTYPPSCFWNWSHGTQITVTFLFLILAVLAVFVSTPPPKSNHFVSLGIKDLPLIVLDQDSGKVCYAGTPPGASEYLNWYSSNVGPITDDEPMYCSDVVWLGEGAKIK